MSQPYGYLHVVQAIHGDALTLEYGSGANQDKTQFMLIDGGPAQWYIRNGVQTGTTENLFKLLTDLSDDNRKVGGQTRTLEFIDTVVVTHDDADHKNGIADLFKYLLNSNPPNAVWAKGATLMTGGEAPIKRIWYNSQATVINEYIQKHKPKRKYRKRWLDNTGVPVQGWFDTLLETYNQRLSSVNNNHHKIAFNEEFKNVLLKADTVTKTSGRDAHRGHFAIKFKGPSEENLMSRSLIKQLIHTTTAENARLVNVKARTASAGGKGPGSVSKAPSADYSEKNRSSIAFLAIFQRSTGPGAHTRLLMLGDAMLTTEFLAGNYTIMKIAHHGSSHNNYLGKHAALMKSVNIKVTEGTAKQAFAFFYKVKAEKYVISASGKEGSPNPHISTILGIFLSVAENRYKDRKTPSVDIYLTNELHPKALEVFGSFVKDPAEARDTFDTHILERQGKHGKNTTNPKVLEFLKENKLETFVKLWLLKPNIAYGSIPIFDPLPNNQDYWIPFHQDALFQKTTPQGVGTPAANVNAIANTLGSPPPKRKK